MGFHTSVTVLIIQSVPVWLCHSRVVVYNFAVLFEHGGQIHTRAVDVANSVGLVLMESHVDCDTRGTCDPP